ncbi:DUF3422 family protein [Bradyrhizobium barranii]|jgi:hypothetical protein|uniref:DUF1761 domain-containing protein n=1 Tax=Bradyrhizobium barranii subsp. barranii TaxID=2823807 RepID=A0A7Z0Q363_9BRAD|nr:DUF3422 family protein [Bradyrhizobium barranii]UGX96920.1 DUF3422 family protein [Bradyrhizobium barranii subsp. barranii]
MDETATGQIAMFNTAGDYHELNAGAHRKPPKVLSAPSLVWHLAFWTNFQEEGDRREQPVNPEWAPNKRPEEINTALDRFIRELWIGLETKRGIPIEVTPRIGGVNLLFGSAYRKPQDDQVDKLTRRQNDIFASTNRVVSLQFVWQLLDVTIRFETQAEYFTMSVFVELDRPRNNTPTGIAELNETMNRIVAYLDPDRHLSTGGQPAASLSQQAVDQLAKDINRYSFHEFWRAFDEEVLSLGGSFRNDAIFQRVCADFRGFVASERAVTFGDDRFFKFNGPPSWGAEAKQALLPLIQHRIRADHTRYECAANYMLDGRALYLSTLGPQLPEISDGERIPVEFIVYAHQRVGDRTVVNKWQLGRLVSQILQLGTFRLCALKDVRWLHNAGLELADLEEATQRARRAIAQTEAYGTRPGESVPATANQRNRVAMAEIAKAHAQLNEITGKFLLKTGSGPLYRIERSRYYVRQFEQNVKLLRILRLEGDQPYDQFIRRRLGPEFDFIDRLGVRYERAMSSIVSLDQNYLSITQNSLVERATKIDEETKTIQSEIGLIQRWGEFILLSCLVPYYVSHLLVLIMGEGWTLKSRAAGGVWLLSIAFAIYRAFNQTFTRRGLVLILLPFALAEIALVAMTLIAPPQSEHHQPESDGGGRTRSSREPGPPKPETPGTPDEPRTSQQPSLQSAEPATPVPAPPAPAQGAMPQPSAEPR